MFVQDSVSPPIPVLNNEREEFFCHQLQEKFVLSNLFLLFMAHTTFQHLPQDPSQSNNFNFRCLHVIYIIISMLMVHMCNLIKPYLTLISMLF